MSAVLVILPGPFECNLFSHPTEDFYEIYIFISVVVPNEKDVLKTFITSDLWQNSLNDLDL